MRRILGLGDRGSDVALIQDTLNRLMPFQLPATRRSPINPLLSQTTYRLKGGFAARNPLKGPFPLYSWGVVRSWGDLSYVWGPGALRAYRAHHRHDPSLHLKHSKSQHFARLNPDGHFGPRTEGAVKAFQELNGMSPDGIFGPATWDRLIPTSFFTIFRRMESGDRSPTDWGLLKAPTLWSKPDDNKGCYAPIRLATGATPPPGYQPVPARSDDDAPGIKVEVQTGLQTGDALGFVLGQIIFVRPRGPDDNLRSLPGHNEMAMGFQLNRNFNTKDGGTNQFFVSLTRADMIKVEGKRLGFSVDGVFQPYISTASVSTGHGAAGAQLGGTANLNFTPLLKSLLGEKTIFDSALFLTIAGQGEVAPDQGSSLSVKFTLPITFGLKVNASF